ncbi:hypothetical protein LOTGIDRAFT_161339 [Lottia gigantea]|uniref:D-isomer specific 2-hydroxyacid dehydrogenase NAD-binding domain-containing protein n=1 Tax=Lottia gigantea TaxID=225164 RepID=V4AG43_LOTGI|nr:hypothetical protein LOTGIDRAFT_161339 [Lottia gigantea]ESO94140.1 hypothetical protein LOTGIDRAFT_161339 [Lottia gigantea]
MSEIIVLLLVPSKILVDYIRQHLQNATIYSVVRKYGVPPAEEQLPDLSKVEICFGAEYLFDAIMKKYPTIKWFHSLSAGNSKAMASLMKLKERPLYTKNIKAYDQNMSQFIITHILCHEKRILENYKNQQVKQWTDFGNFRSLSDVTIGILGLGIIGKSVADLCKIFNMKTWAMTRVEPTEKLSSIDHYSQNLEDILVNCDYIVACLPSTPATRGILNGGVLSICRKKPVVINVGRGDLINEDSVITALRSGWITNAVLDAFEKEPLPQSSRLWTEPGVIVSPHCSFQPYGQQECEELAQGFLDNYHRYISGQKLIGLVSIDKQY